MKTKFTKELKWFLTGGPVYLISQKTKDFFKEIKYFFQRGFRGYSDEDIYDIDVWFCKIFPLMLRDLSKHLDKVPQAPMSLLKEIREIPAYENYTDEEIEIAFAKWQAILEDMASSFEKGNRYNDALSQSEKERLKNKAFDLLKEHFYDLWW